MVAPLGNEILETRSITKQELFDVRTCGPLQPTPFLDGHQNSGIYASLRNDLRPFS